MTPGERIQHYREIRGLSTLRLARMAQMREEFLLKIESSVILPQTRTLQKIADALDVSLDVLLGNELPGDKKRLEDELPEPYLSYVKWTMRLSLSLGVLLLTSLALLATALLLERFARLARPLLSL